MAFFIKTTSRTTFTKYLVEAENAAEARRMDGEYLGVVDADTNGVVLLSEQFESRTDAMTSDHAYTEYR
jgi:hypothetical protein